MSSHAQDRQHTLLVLGDSISAAYGMSLEEGWVALITGQLAATRPNLRVVNASISGETSGGAVLRLPALLKEHQPALVLIELGGNDGLRGYPVATLRTNLDTLTRQSLDAGARVIILPMEIPPNYGSRYTKSFRASYTTVAQDTDAILGPFILQDIATDPALMQADGIHPAVNAQQKISDQVLPAVLEALP